jgi:hypothetical protein
MASGDFAYSDPRDFFISIPWIPSGCCVLTNNGFEYYNDDGQGGYYCASGDYLESGYIFFNQFNIGYTGVATGAFTDSTGDFCCTAFSDGTGGYYWNNIYYYGTVLSCSGQTVGILNQLFNNGYSCLVSAGDTSCFEVNNYCEIGYSFFCSGGLSYNSDEEGSYFFTELVERNLYNVSIDWDFSKRTKEEYNFIELQGNGNALCISIQNQSNLFYEINSILDTTLCIYEASICKSLLIEDSCAPFLYFKNIGSSIVNIDLSSGTFNREFFKNCQIYSKNNYSGSSIFLCKNDSVFLTFNVSSSGTHYYSNVVYPFGFFYEFKNIELVNPNGFYPVCCDFDINNNCCFPIFTYSDVCNLPIQDNSVLTGGYGYSYKKLLSFSENLTVDNSDLEISFFKNTGTGIGEIKYIETEFNLNSCYGINCHNAIISTKEIVIFDELEFCCLSSGECFSKNINSNSCIKVIYDVDFKISKKYNLIYLHDCCINSDYNFSIIIDSLSGINTIDKNTFSGMNNLIELNNSEFAYIDIHPCENTAIKNLSNAKMQRDNLYLPIASDFSYCYCFLLRNSNYIDKKITTGFWSNPEDLVNNSGFCNYTTLIHCEDPEYIQYKSLNYCIDLCISDSKYSTTGIQNKDLFDTSDSFSLNYCSMECCFFYSGMEFRYVPVDTVFYKNYFYKIPNCCIELNFYLSGNHEATLFPANALDFNKLKIKTTFELFENPSDSQIVIDYDDFNFSLSCCFTSYINYKFPIIQCSNLSGYQNPRISICNNIDTKTESNIVFEINPSKCFISESYYGLNNFLLFINSKLNGGLALDFINCSSKVMSDYEYNSNLYSFLMMDVACEYFCNFTGSTISGDWTKILEYISFEDSFNYIPYKNNTGVGYNYLFPVLNSICYKDSYTGNNEEINFTKEITGILNCINTGFNYDGLSTFGRILTGSTGQLTGTGYFPSSGASFFNFCNTNLINLDSNDLTGTVPHRSICICRSYDFTGVQPICIISNYPLFDIYEPIVCTNFKKYSYDINDESSGVYYYLYDILNPKNSAVKFIAPDLTYITDLCWEGQLVTSTPNSSKIAQILNNLARVDLGINNFIYNNPYYLNMDSLKTLCINLIGGL